MVVEINGKAEEIPGSVVLDALNAKQIDPQMVAVELNDTLIERDHLGSTPLQPGDHLEFLFYMGGGR